MKVRAKRKADVIRKNEKGRGKERMRRTKLKEPRTLRLTLPLFSLTLETIEEHSCSLPDLEGKMKLHKQTLVLRRQV